MHCSDSRQLSHPKILMFASCIQSAITITSVAQLTDLTVALHACMLMRSLPNLLHTLPPSRSNPLESSLSYQYHSRESGLSPCTWSTLVGTVLRQRPSTDSRLIRTQLAVQNIARTRSYHCRLIPTNVHNTVVSKELLI